MKQDDEIHTSPASRALERSLRRALRNHKRAQRKLKPDPVHDFRVALRRCRSLAEGLHAVDPDPVWMRLRKASKRQQRALSDLRDIQVLTNWLEPLRLTGGPVGEALASYFKKTRKARRERGSKLLESVSAQKMEALVAASAGGDGAHSREPAPPGATASRAIRSHHRAPRELDEATECGNLARAAGQREALPLHDREFSAGKKRCVECGTPGDAGPSRRRSRPGRAARPDREARAQEILAQKRRIAVCAPRRYRGTAAPNQIRFPRLANTATKRAFSRRPQRASQVTNCMGGLADGTRIYGFDQSPRRRRILEVRTQKSVARSGASESISRQATPDFFKAVNGAVAFRACAMNSSICGACPKQITSPVSRASSSARRAGFASGLSASVVRNCFESKPKTSQTTSPVCTARTKGLVRSAVGLMRRARRPRAAARVR